MSAEPIVLSRDELYALVWEAPLSTLALRYGVRGDVLAAWCRRLRIPYPAPGYWTAKAHGKEGLRPPLGPGPAGLAVARLLPKDPSETRRTEQAPQKRAAEEKPHPLIAAWLQERARDREESPYMPDWTATERRRLAILDRLFKGLETLGYRPEAPTARRLMLVLGEECVGIELREKLKRAPYNPTLPSFASAYKMVPSGVLVFTFRAYLGDASLPKEWADEPGRPLETRCDEIIATLAEARPILIDLAAKLQVVIRERRAELARRQAEAERRDDERRRWRRFSTLTRQWRDAQEARALLEVLKAAPHNQQTRVGERSLEEWLEWVAAQADARDPTRWGAERAFQCVERRDEEEDQA